MKRKIAMFATGWGEAILLNYGQGIAEAMEQYDADLYLFLGYPTMIGDKESQTGELNIFTLPDLKDFDAAILLGNGLDFDGVFENLIKRCKAAGIPAVSTGRKSDYAYFVGSDNYAGSYALAKHLVFDHGVKKPVFIAGTADNPDSNTRLQALKDVMNEAGLPFSDDQVFYSQWEAKRSDDFAYACFKGPASERPDAFICANDPLAMAACMGIERAGFAVPNDAIVTGFDNDFFAQICSPSISSVDQRFDMLGKEAFLCLMDVLDGKERPKEQTYPCQYLPSESCGCYSARNFDQIRRMHGKNTYRSYMTDSLMTTGISSFEKTILTGASYEDLRTNLYLAYEKMNFYLGDSFQVVIEPLYEKGIFNSDRSLRVEGYSRVMDAVFSMDRGKYLNNPNFESAKLLPQDNGGGKNRIHIFAPIHERESNFGYVILSDDIKKVGNFNHLHVFLESMSNALAKYKQNLSLSLLNTRLLEITETDALTHVKNRNSYDAKEKEYNTKIKFSSKVSFGIAMFDINNLKVINDELGHEAGDEYIINSCMLVCKTFKHSPVYRIGGDEFLAFLQGADYEHREELIERLRQTVNDLDKQDIPLVEKLSVASGVAVYDPSIDNTVLDVFKRADGLMYENKAMMKGKNNIR